MEFHSEIISFFSFGDDIQRWLSTVGFFYTNYATAVLNKGFCANYFQTSRGVRHGSPLSSYLFIITVYPMACKLRQDKELHGIKLFDKEFKIGHLDDDTTLFRGDKGSIKSAIMKC